MKKAMQEAEVTSILYDGVTMEMREMPVNFPLFIPAAWSFTITFAASVCNAIV
jgi:hypothetical protein